MAKNDSVLLNTTVTVFVIIYTQFLLKSDLNKYTSINVEKIFDWNLKFKYELNYLQIKSGKINKKISEYCLINFDLDKLNFV